MFYFNICKGFVICDFDERLTVHKDQVYWFDSFDITVVIADSKIESRVIGKKNKAWRRAVIVLQQYGPDVKENN